MKKRLTAILLMLVMVFAMLPVTAYSATTVSSVNIIYNVSDFQLYTSSVEKIVSQKIQDKINTNTIGVRIRKGSSFTGLEYKINKYEYTWAGDSSVTVKESNNYYMCVRFQLGTGYEWPEEIIQLTTRMCVPLTQLRTFKVFLNKELYTGDGYIKRYDDLDVGIDISIPIANDIPSITLSPASFVYDGKVKTPRVTSAKLKNGDLVNSGMYTVTYVDQNDQEVAPVNPGTYYVLLKGEGIYGAGRKAFSINKIENTIRAKGKTVKIKTNKIKRKKQIIKPAQYLTVSNAYGNLAYKLAKVKKAKFKKYFKVNPRNGNITVRKGLKKGTYKLKINVTASGNGNYLPGTKPVTVTIRVK